MKSKLNSKSFRARRVIATDAHFTGEEPVWTDCQPWPTEKFLETRARAIRFYNYYLTPGELKGALLEWMELQEYTKRDVAAIRGAPSYVPSPTTSKLALSILQGMPEANLDAGTADGKYIRTNLRIALSEIASGLYSGPAEKSTEPAGPVLGPLDHIRNKVSKTVLSDLDKMLDQWILARSDRPIEELNIASLLEANSIPQQGCGGVVKWIDRVLNEFREAQEGKCPQLAEGYSYLSRKAMRARIEALETMKSQIVVYVAGKKALRKPRVKKDKPAEKQIGKVKYMTSCKEFNLNSISPILIPSAQGLFVFNTKYKTLGYYSASGPKGLSVKGTSIKDFDSKLSFTRGLRKPAEVLPIVLGKTALQIGRALEALTTKRKEARGRINEDTIILRAFNS